MSTNLNIEVSINLTEIDVNAQLAEFARFQQVRDDSRYAQDVEREFVLGPIRHHRRQLEPSRSAPLASTEQPVAQATTHPSTENARVPALVLRSGSWRALPVAQGGSSHIRIWPVSRSATTTSTATRHPPFTNTSASTSFAPYQRHRGSALQTSECTICFEKPVDPRGCPKCLKVIGCKKCVKKWFDTSASKACPLCRFEWKLHRDNPDVVKISTLEVLKRQKQNRP
ncbi:RING-type domain-containing protein [Caenorhabditis elegans]|uniref:RING-type domain-containing protein n=1 Tax=Caenorhabditis elegans TaxID=6239 RepID=Q18466_CAEEL|nr:RING-type domain-containing protein [Caenorhabditis elegans]CCD65822.1 RING-type domain-containing protein [Caenorhabditis elegans]|eukprot:NP_494977.1 Uncharacterized protein CELE_C34F11.1 [Caenorhabditis elegans]